LRGEAAAVVAAAPDVIIANSSPVFSQLRKQSTTLPMVAGDRSAWERLRAEPGATRRRPHRFHQLRVCDQRQTWLQTLKEAAPAVKRIAIVFNPQTAPC
jgi:putative ABC transport system substrate-binding protein